MPLLSLPSLARPENEERMNGFLQPSLDYNVPYGKELKFVRYAGGDLSGRLEFRLKVLYEDHAQHLAWLGDVYVNVFRM